MVDLSTACARSATLDVSRSSVVPIALIALALFGPFGLRDSSAAARTHTVTIEDMRFSPESLTVDRGDRIVWINKDLFPHTASASSGAFDSGSIAPNGSWTYSADKPGGHAYLCNLHPTMRAKLTVRDQR